jgi:hypothetical protein
VPSDALWTDDERVEVLEHRWWTRDELAATADNAHYVSLKMLTSSLLIAQTDSPTSARFIHIS